MPLISDILYQGSTTRELLYIFFYICQILQHLDKILIKSKKRLNKKKYFLKKKSPRAAVYA